MVFLLRLSLRLDRFLQIRTLCVTKMTSLSIWYLGYSKPRQESLAKEHLERQGFECFFPLISTEKMLKGKLCVVNEPLFPRYLFIKVRPGMSLSPIRSTMGMNGLVVSNGMPQQVQEQLILQIKSRFDERLMKPLSLFNKGDIVQIIEGAFQGLEAIYVESNEENRALLLLDLLGKTNELKFELTQLKKV